MISDIESFTMEFGSLDVILSDDVKLRIQTHWKINNHKVDELGIVLVSNKDLWKGSVNGLVLKRLAQDLGLTYEDYCISLKYAFVSPWGPKNDIFSFENGVLRWRKILKVGSYFLFGDFFLNLVTDGDLLAATISSLLDSNCVLREEFEKISEQNLEIQKGWNDLKQYTEEMIKTKKQMENKLYDQFVAILNEKKKKICNLKRMGEPNV